MRQHRTELGKFRQGVTLDAQHHCGRPLRRPYRSRGGPLAALAQDAIAAPGQKTIGQPQATKDAMIPSLAVINSRGATLQGALTLTCVSANSIVFADRPFRAAGTS